MGEIFSAFDEKLNRTVALKVIAADLLDDRARRRVIGEARAAAALDHPFICAVHDVLEHDGQPIIIMEWVQGETLQARISRGPLPVAELSRRCVRTVGRKRAGFYRAGSGHYNVRTPPRLVGFSRCGVLKAASLCRYPKGQRNLG